MLIFISTGDEDRFELNVACNETIACINREIDLKAIQPDHQVLREEIKFSYGGLIKVDSNTQRQSNHDIQELITLRLSVSHEISYMFRGQIDKPSNWF